VSRSRLLDISVGDQRKTVDLRDYLDPTAAEEAASSANAWIKALRHVDVNGKPLRDRFTYRGDSLWWFAELYLHKQGVITDVWETALALEALAHREKPTHVRAADADGVLRHLLPQTADRYGFQWTIDTPAAPARATATWKTNLRAHAYTWSALASRLHPRRLWPLLFPRLPHSSHATHSHSGSGSGSGAGRLMPSRLRRRKGAAPRAGGGTVVFAHSAFWRHAPGSADEGEEGYIGKVVRELKTFESQNGAEARPLRMIGLGPRTNFRARRWWHPLRRQLLDAHDLPLTPIEEFASWRALSGSREMWRDRLAIERALLGSTALRDCAHVRDYGIWPIVAAELRGVARLQFPWSARAMDEAAAALDACRPRLIVTYAEAGGWGRALMLEARRRGIATAGLQHGFIYRHWLNYLHADDEMLPSPGNRHDRGFPRPDLTLLYDEYAADHLRRHGHFPEQSLRVTGSPALDTLTAAVAHVTDADRARVREQLGATPGERLVLVVSKFTQIGAAIPSLAAAVASLPGVRLVIKPHPAETPEPYLQATASAPRVTIAPAALDLASLLASARLLVTVNSTVAIDAMTLGVPALAVLLPNNLTPFVEAGAMAGSAHAERATDGLAETLAALTGDDECHAALAARARAFAEAQGIRADGQAAVRAVQAMAALYNG
jgi:hypothetical protein